MGVRINDRVTEDGKRLEKTLRELAALEVRIGFQQRKVNKDGVDLVDIAMFNELGTVRIPSRPFLRNSVDSNSDKINAFLQTRKKGILNGESAKETLKEIGVFQKGLIQEQIVEGSFAPNAEATIRKKKSATPLIDTGRMRQSVNFVIRKKGGSD